MPKDISKLLAQIQPLIQQEFSRLSQQREKSSQFTVGAIPVHTHNNIDSSPIQYTDLAGVKNYCVANTVTLSVAQVSSLFTTPIVLVPPPSPRSVIIVHSVTARLTYGGNPYTGANAMEFRYTSGAGTKVTVDIPAAFINSTASAFAHAPAVTAEFAPIEGGTSLNGQIVVAVPTANPGIIAGSALTATAGISAAATSATLTGAWGNPNGVGQITFSDGEKRQVTFTNGSANITWTGGLTNSVTSALTFGGFQYSPIILTIHYHVVSFAT